MTYIPSENRPSLLARVSSAVKQTVTPSKAITFQTLRLSESLREVAQMDLNGALERRNTCLDGVTDEEAVERLERYGKNAVAREEHKTIPKQLLKLLFNPLNTMLLILAMVNFLFLHDFES